MSNYGYVKSFSIEYDPTVKKRISCRDCGYYDQTDKSCMKRPLYLPEDGYNSWRTCKFFELNSSTSNYDNKRAQYSSLVNHPNKKNKNDLDGQYYFALNDNGNTLNVSKMSINQYTSFDKLDLELCSNKRGKYVIYIDISQIFVPEDVKKTTPGRKKLQEIEEFYEEYQSLDKPILVKQVNGRCELVDGYARWYFANENGVKKIPAILSTSVGIKRNKLCKKGQRVKHKVFGIGNVVKYDIDKIWVDFKLHKDIRDFDLDFCADSNYINLIE